jgi:hypothetical protein
VNETKLVKWAVFVGCVAWVCYAAAFVYLLLAFPKGEMPSDQFERMVTSVETNVSYFGLAGSLISLSGIGLVGWATYAKIRNKFLYLAWALNLLALLVTPFAFTSVSPLEIDEVEMKAVE